MVSTIGVIGGGQLCRMMGQEIIRKGLPFEIIALDPTRECPAYKHIEKQIIGDFKDPDCIIELAEQSDIVTYEIELANGSVLEDLKRAGKPVHPSPKTLQIVQDKYTQASFLSSNEIPVPRYRKVENKDGLLDVIDEFGLPLMLKARRDSYDGRGNYLIKKEQDIDEALGLFKDRDLMAQKYVDFSQEISVIAARNTKGEIKTYPVGENIHVDNILHTTIAPARISPAVERKARDIAVRTLDCLKGAGVFGIEMFVDKDGNVLVNEIAPRVHNSGHYTIEACETSQFEQHLRAINGWPLGETDLIYQGYTVMHNILGDSNIFGGYKLEGLGNLFDKTDGLDINTHLYGKKEVREGRKMGHFTIVDKECNYTPEELVAIATGIRESLKFKPYRGD